MSTITSQELEFLAGRFAVIIPGMGYIGSFATVSDLKKTVNEIKRKVGGSNYAKKIPGSVDIENVTVTRALLRGDRTMYDRMERLTNALDERATIDDNAIYEEMHVIQMSRNSTPLVRYRLYDAWFQEYTEGGFDADKDEIRMATAVISVKYWEADENVGAIPELTI